MNITYENFYYVNKTLKNIHTLRILFLRDNICTIKVGDNDIYEININTLINNVVYSGIYNVINPSILKRWKGWKNYNAE